MRAETVNAFLNATTRVLKQFCGGCDITVQKDKIAVRTSPVKLFETNVHVGIIGDLSGVVYYSFPLETAAKVASTMTGINSYEEGTLSEMAKSALCELANIISGQAAMELSLQGHRLDLSPPALFTGHGVLSSSFQNYLVGIPLESALGHFEIDLAISEQK